MESWDEDEFELPPSDVSLITHLSATISNEGIAAANWVVKVAHIEMEDVSMDGISFGDDDDGEGLDWGEEEEHAVILCNTIGITVPELDRKEIKVAAGGRINPTLSSFDAMSLSAAPITGTVTRFRRSTQASPAMSPAFPGQVDLGIDGFDESDFDLPCHISHITLSPIVPRYVSSSSNQYDHHHSLAPSTTHLQLPHSTKPMRLFTASSPSPSLPIYTDAAEDDDEFFDEIVLPSYFVGGPGPLTPPSEGGRGSKGSREKIDLQAVLQRKLEERSRNTESLLAEGIVVRYGDHADEEETDWDEEGVEIDEDEAIAMHSRQPLPLQLPTKTTEVTDDAGGRPTPILDRQHATFAPSRTPTLASIFSRIPLSSPTKLRRLAAANIPPSPHLLAMEGQSRNCTPPHPSHTAASSSPTTTLRCGTALATPLQRRAVSRINTTRSTTLVLPPSPMPSPLPTLGSKTILRQRGPPSFASSPAILARGGLRSVAVHSGALSPLPSTTPVSSPYLSSTVATPRLDGRRLQRTSHRLPILHPPPPSISSHSPVKTSSASSASSSRLLQPTLASRAKVRGELSTLLSSATLNLRQPKRAQHYGDGSELDGFDDLPTSRDRERQLAVAITKDTIAATAGARSSFAALGGMDPNATNKAAKAGMRTIRGTFAMNRAVDVDAGTQGERKRVRREPQLIRNLGPKPTRKQGNMTWNPSSQQWDGNEGSLRSFAHRAPSRPTLISNRMRTLTPSIAPSPFLQQHQHVTAARSNAPSNAKVVGSMVFDPVRMSWFSVPGEEEDELDLSLNDIHPISDSPHDGAAKAEDGWERGEHARMLQTKTSFLSGERGGRAGIMSESVAAERRHRTEMSLWMPRWAVSKEEREDREWLYDIRRLILESQSP